MCGQTSSFGRTHNTTDAESIEFIGNRVSLSTLVRVRWGGGMCIDEIGFVPSAHRFCLSPRYTLRFCSSQGGDALELLRVSPPPRSPY